MEIKSEMVTYSGESGKDVAAYLVMPASKEIVPGVVLIHEIFGLKAHTKDVAERVAKEGYVVLAPHLYSTDAELDSILSESNVAVSMKFMSKLDRTRMRDSTYMQEMLVKEPKEEQQIISRLMGMMFGGMPKDKLIENGVKAVEFLNSKDFVKKGKIATMGFCFGGGMSGNISCRTKTAACIIFYGESPSPIELVEKIDGAVLGLYGAEDTRINMELDKFVTELTKNKKDFEIKIYKNAAHAFFNNTNPQTYNEEAAKDAWIRVTSLLERELKK
jgi:carboxymethylenebutenolidase